MVARLTSKPQGAGHWIEFGHYSGNGIVVLTESETEFIRHLSDTRIQRNAERRIKDQANIPELKDPVVQAYALAAEFAFCKLINRYPPIEEGDYGAPDAWFKGDYVDVKLKRKGNDAISINWNGRKAKAPNLSIFVAMQGMGKTIDGGDGFKMLGFMQRVEIEERYEKQPDRNGKGGVYYWVPVKDLYKEDRMIIGW